MACQVERLGTPRARLHGARPGPKLAPSVQAGPPACPAAESARNDPCPEEKRSLMCKKSDSFWYVNKWYTGMYSENRRDRRCRIPVWFYTSYFFIPYLLIFLVLWYAWYQIIAYHTLTAYVSISCFFCDVAMLITYWYIILRVPGIIYTYMILVWHTLIIPDMVYSNIISFIGADL